MAGVTRAGGLCATEGILGWPWTFWARGPKEYPTDLRAEPMIAGSVLIGGDKVRSHMRGAHHSPHNVHFLSKEATASHRPTLTH